MSQVARSQNNNTKLSADSLTGTWAGSFTQLSDNSKNKHQNSFMWRIHKIDVAKQQVELTEIGNHFNDGSIIDNPKKLTYKGYIEDNCLVIEFNSQKTNSNTTFRLQIKRMDGMLMLQEISAPDDKTGESTLIGMLGKISNDISTYTKPKEGEIEVAIAAPPPIKN